MRIFIAANRATATSGFGPTHRMCINKCPIDFNKFARLLLLGAIPLVIRTSGGGLPEDDSYRCIRSKIDYQTKKVNKQEYLTLSNKLVCKRSPSQGLLSLNSICVLIG